MSLLRSNPRVPGTPEILEVIPQHTLRIFGIWAVWSAAVVMLAAAASKLPGAAPSPWPPTIAKIAPPLARWDSGWYLQIAAEGYRFDQTQPQNNIGFYPLYPLLVRWLARWPDVSMFAVGICLSLICLLGALFLLHGLAREWGDASTGDLTIIALLFFPTAFFLGAFYTESLFLFASTAAFWTARRGHWWLTGVAGGMTCLTRFNGFLIILPILWMIWRDGSPRARRLRPGSVFAILGTLAGAAAYPVYLWSHWSDPLLYVHSKRDGWGQHATLPWRLLREVLRRGVRYLTLPGQEGRLAYCLEVGSLVLFTILTGVLIRKGLTAEGIYCAANLLLIVCSGTLDGLHRYVLVLFPCFYVLARGIRESDFLMFAYSFVGVGLGISLLTRYVNWLPVG